MPSSSRVTMREVGTRDGLQSLGAFVPTERKIELINALARTGLTRVEATSFVHPVHVPQMADAEQVMAGIHRVPGVVYEALVPNVRGAERAIAADADVIGLVLAASDAFNLQNVHLSVADSLRLAEDVRQLADDCGKPSTAGIATAFGCPYAGDVPLVRLLEVVDRLVVIGFTEISLADTTGMANPAQVERTVATVVARYGDRAQFGVHFHNTRGMGLANVVAAFTAGARQFDASIGGIGGCPFAPRATGNISTEDTVHMLHEMGISTGIDLDALIAVAARMQEVLDKELPGQVMKAGPVQHSAHAPA